MKLNLKMRVLIPKMRNMDRVHCEECGESIEVAIEFEEEFVTICKTCLLKAVEMIENRLID